MNKDVCQDIIDYGRHHIIGNEQQFLSVVLCLATAYSNRPSEYIPAFIVGELSGGKTHVQNTAHKLINPEHEHAITSASDKAPIYSDQLRDNDEICIIRLGEYQKLSKPILEYMKSLSGDDPEFYYEVTVNGHTERIPQKKRVYTITYAQIDIDPELESRVFVTSIVENHDMNRAVAMLKFGATEVEYQGRTYIIEPCPEIETRIMDAITSIASIDMDVRIPYTHALIDMVNHSKAVSKKHANMITSLIKASARLNWMNRESDNGKIIASGQDVANILVMFDLFRATTMSIDYIDMTIYRRLCNVDMQTEESLIKYLQMAGLAELTRIELSRRLDKLYNENYIIRETSSGGYLYSHNKHKQVIDLKVNWSEIYKHDQNEIVDIMTDETFVDIREFGKHIEQVFTLHDSNTDMQRPPISTAVSDKDAGIMSCVEMWLQEPDTDKSRSGIANGIMNEPDMQGRLNNVNYYDVINVLKLMEENGRIEYNNDEYRLT